MVIDQKKYDRQTLGFGKWKDNLKVSPVKAGYLIYPTGTGKTMVAIMAIQAMYAKHPDRTSIVIVPSLKIKEDWEGHWELNEETKKREWVEGHIEKHNLKRELINVYVINTYVKYVDWKCDLLIIDELHHALSLESKYFSTVISISTYQFGMGLSATLSEEQQEIARSLGWYLVDTISVVEAEVEGFISNSITYNLAIDMNEEDKAYQTEINESFKYYFNKFEFEFDVLRACNIHDDSTMPVKTRSSFLGSKTGKDWRLWWAKHNDWNGDDKHDFSPKNIKKYAAQGMLAMSKRKKALNNMPSKFKFIKQLTDKFPKTKTIIFSESSDFADKVVELFPHKALAYHTNLLSLAIKDDSKILNPSKEDKVKLKAQGYKIKGNTVLKREAFQEFSDPDSKINIMSVVRALDEGVDIPAIAFTIHAAYNSTEKQRKQRNGRGSRIDYNDANKIALHVNLYIRGSQEEKWLKTSQKNMQSIRWVDSVDEISINQTLSLGKFKQRPKTPTQIGGFGINEQLH